MFVHIPKAAGQSIETVFLDHHDLTWETRAPLLMRKNEDPDLGPPRLAHLTAEEYIEKGHLTRSEWEAYFTFSFVRNPWARAVSIYKYWHHHRQMSFPRFAKEKLAGEYWHTKYWFVRPQCEFICDSNGNIMVDFVGRVERIQRDFRKVCNRLGLEEARLPHRNKSNDSPLSPAYWGGYRKIFRFMTGAVRQVMYARDSYAQYYTPKARDTVASLYEQDIERFNYSFDALAQPPGEAARVPSPVDERLPVGKRG